MDSITLSISSVVFNSPFMFQDPVEIRKELQNRLQSVIKDSDLFNKKHNGKDSIVFTIILNQTTKDLEIKGPSIGKTFVDYAIWIPIKKIQNSDNQIIEYLFFVKKAMLNVLEKYDFDLNLISDIFLSLEKEEIEKLAERK